MTSLDSPLIFPLGHHHGTVPDRTGTVVHEMWRGGELIAVPEDVFRAWASVHRPPMWQADRPWSTQAMLEHARRTGLDDAAGHLDELRRGSLVAEVWPDTVDAREVARGLHLHPTMLGLGNNPEDATVFGIGLIGSPRLLVTRNVFELWRWAPVTANLWDLCLFFTEQERAHGATDPERVDPDTVLTGLLHCLGALVGGGVAYLDLAE